MAEARSLDQERAAYAWKAVGASPADDYTNLAKAAPALIMSNGLMQTLAFYKSKGKDHHKRLLCGILGWLAQSLGDFPEDFEGAMERLHSADSDLYMRATEEALEILRWIRQFAAARKGA
ncbi:MAG: type III-B CRISPR module-associated protein Cmr5 [Acidobacteriota bacterium]